jgi:hypothetical protein
MISRPSRFNTLIQCQKRWPEPFRRSFVSSHNTFELFWRHKTEAHIVYFQQKPDSNNMQEQQATPTKSVSFNTRVQLRLAIHINNYSTKARKAAFYTEKDYMDFLRDAKKTAKLIESGVVLRDNNFCRRGVESMTKDGAALRQTNRKKGTPNCTVVREQ